MSRKKYNTSLTDLDTDSFAAWVLVSWLEILGLFLFLGVPYCLIVGLCAVLEASL